jgi:hypothetical protein
MLPQTGDLIVINHVASATALIQSISGFGVLVWSSILNNHTDMWWGIVGSNPSLSATLTYQEAAYHDVDCVDFRTTVGWKSPVMGQNNTNYASVATSMLTNSITTTNPSVLIIAAIGAISTGAHPVTQSNPLNGFTLYDGVSWLYITGYYESLGTLVITESIPGTYSSGVSFASPIYAWSIIASFQEISGGISGDGLTWVSSMTKKHVPKLVPWARRFPKFMPRTVI